MKTIFKKKKTKTVESVRPGLVSQKLTKSVIRGSGKSALAWWPQGKGELWTLLLFV